jgi:hypothetical protein
MVSFLSSSVQVNRKENDEKVSVALRGGIAGYRSLLDKHIK